MIPNNIKEYLEQAKTFKWSRTIMLNYNLEYRDLASLKRKKRRKAKGHHQRNITIT